MKYRLKCFLEKYRNTANKSMHQDFKNKTDDIMYSLKLCFKKYTNIKKNVAVVQGLRHLKII